MKRVPLVVEELERAETEVEECLALRRAMCAWRSWARRHRGARQIQRVYRAWEYVFVQ